MLEVCVVGLGALGALYGFVLETSGKARVTAVCRSNFKIVKSRGVDIRSAKFGNFDAWNPSRVVSTPEDAADRQYDYVICATKFIPDVITTSCILGPLLSHTSTFVLIQNGIGIHDELRQAAPNAVIISACAWVDATAVDGGNVIQHGRMDRLDLGIHWPTGAVDETFKSTSQMRLKTLVDAFVGGKCNATTVEDIEAARWRKNLLNIGYSVFCTLTGASCSTLLSDKWIATTTPIIRGFMEEAVSVARATGLSVPDSTITLAEETACLQHAESHPQRSTVPLSKQHFKPSMLVDLEAGRPLEVEGIVGGVVRKGRDARVPLPRLEAAYAALSIIQEPLVLGSRNQAAV